MRLKEYDLEVRGQIPKVVYIQKPKTEVVDCKCPGLSPTLRSLEVLSSQMCVLLFFYLRVEKAWKSLARLISE